jgi:hypothetical protein
MPNNQQFTGYQQIKVPRSCIEATETILRKHSNSSYEFTEGGQGSSADRPAMYLWLKNGYAVTSVSINVTDNDSEETFRAAENKQSYLSDRDQLVGRVAVGEGVAFIRTSGESTDEFDMHFLPILKILNDKITFGDISQPEKWNYRSTRRFETFIEATTVGELRKKLGEPYTDTRFYSFGIVSLNGQMPPS